MSDDLLRKVDKEGRPLEFAKESRREYHLETEKYPIPKRIQFYLAEENPDTTKSYLL